MIVGPGEKWPTYIDADIPTEELPTEIRLPEQPVWATLYISKGKKAKINKMHVVGPLSKKGGLSQEDLGLILVKDECAYIAVKRDKIKAVIQQTKGEKLKGVKVILEVAK